MNTNQVKGAAKDIAGKAQEKFGEVTNQPGQQVKGMAKQVEGKVQKGVGNVQDAADGAADVADDVGGQRRALHALELLAHRVVGKRQPPGGGDARRFEDGVGLVLAREPIGDHLELQLAHRAEQQRVVVHLLEHLDRAFLAELL